MSQTKPGWQALKFGDALDAGTACEFKTGDWRSEKPVFHKDRCINCLQCWIHCPDMAINVKETKMEGFIYKHCKGCGICAKICPVKGEKAITMEPER